MVKDVSVLKIYIYIYIFKASCLMLTSETSDLHAPVEVTSPRPAVSPKPHKKKKKETIARGPDEIYFASTGSAESRWHHVEDSSQAFTLFTTCSKDVPRRSKTKPFASMNV